MKKVLLVIWGLDGGGAEGVVVNVSKFMNRSKFALALVLFEKKGPYLDSLPPELKVCDLKKRSRYDLLKLIIKLACIIRSFKPDIVLSFGHYANIITILTKIFTFQRCKFCLSEHTYTDISLRELSFSKIRRFLTKILYRKADSIIAVSKGVKDGLVKNFSISESRIKVIYNPIDSTNISKLAEGGINHPWFKEKIPIIITVGRLTKPKGYPYLLKAFKILREMKDVRLVFVGDGEDRKLLEDLSIKLGVSKEIAFLGFQNNPYKYVKKATIFVLSSLWEGFSSVLVEAMTCGIPVIATCCLSGPEEIITDEVNGLLVPPADENSMAKVILRVLKDETLRRRLAEAGKKRAEDFNIKKIIREYETCLTDI